VQKKSEKIKYLLVFLVFVLMAGVIIWELVNIQIKKGEYYQALALGQQISFEEIKGERGNIYLIDKNIVLAQTKKKKILYIVSKTFKENFSTSTEYQNALLKLAEIIKEDSKKLKEELTKNQIIKKEISSKEISKLKKVNFKGVYVTEIFARSYPQKLFASHIIGFLNKEGVGQYGLEGYYNQLLQGKKILEKKSKSPFGGLDFSFIEKSFLKEKKGADLYLTLNYNIQYFAQKLLEKAKQKWDIDEGEIIVSEPSTGKILALVNFPEFDPNQYFLQKDYKIFLNKSIQTLFEPGSVFKPITMAAGLEENIITPETSYEDKGYVRLGGPPIYNFERRVWGKINMVDVLEESVNTGAVFVEQKLGKDLFWKYIQKFGFTERTGIDLQGEVFSRNLSLKNGYPRDFAVASFGQGIDVTSLQLVRAFGAIANGGYLMRPYVVEKIVKGKKIITVHPKVQRKVISSLTSDKLTSMLISVVEQGSGRRAKIPGYLIAGKTGTAQVPLKKGGYSKTKTIQSFVGYFPAFNPKVLIFVKLNNPKGVKTAGLCAAPIFKELARYIINLWEIPPDY